MTTPISDEQIRERIRRVPHWYHRIHIRPGITTPGVNDCETTLGLLDLPQDCRGLRALDVGTRDGFFAFELERRGAKVTAVDYVSADQTGFSVAADLLGSQVEFQHANVYDLSAAALGRFDIVLFLGLLYHLPDPVQALHILRSLCQQRLCLESHVIDNAVSTLDGQSLPLSSVAPALTDVPIMQFYPGTSLNNDPTNYWGPNVACLEAMLNESNFACTSKHLMGTRAVLNCLVTDNADLAYHNRLARGRFGVHAPRVVKGGSG